MNIVFVLRHADLDEGLSKCFVPAGVGFLCVFEDFQASRWEWELWALTLVGGGSFTV